MPQWLVWVIVGGILAVGEILTLAFILGPIAVAAFVAAIVAGAGAGVAVQLAVFGVVSLLSLVAVRPIAKRHLRVPPRIRTGVAALTGQQALVVDAVSARGGTIKLAGEIWSARPLDPADTYPEGAEVTVVEITGATAVVMH